MKANRTVMIGALAALVVVVLWWFVIYSGLKNDASEVSDNIAAAEQEQQSLDAQLEQLEALEQRGPETEAELAELNQTLPLNPDLASFINEAHATGLEAGVLWVSVSPSDPIQTGSVATIQMTMEIEGGYFQVLEYLRLLEDLPRLVVVDAIDINAAENQDAGGTGTGGSSAVTGGAPGLHASLTARMFSLNALTSEPAEGLTSTTTTTAAGGE